MEVLPLGGIEAHRALKIRDSGEAAAARLADDRLLHEKDEQADRIERGDGRFLIADGVRPQIPNADIRRPSPRARAAVEHDWRVVQSDVDVLVAVDRRREAGQTARRDRGEVERASIE